MGKEGSEREVLTRNYVKPGHLVLEKNENKIH